MQRKKILSFLLALFMLVGVFAPMKSYAVDLDGGIDPANDLETFEKEGHKTVIRIHKIVMPKKDMDAHKDEGKLPKYDGTQIGDIKEYFKNGKEVAGVAFDIYQEVDGEGETVKHNNPILGGLGKEGKSYKKVNEKPFISTDSGVNSPELLNGAYIIVENKEASTYTGADGEAITDSKAIPTRIELPMTKPDGSGYFDITNKLHIYPKNTEEKPQIDKNFAKGVGDLANAGADYKNYKEKKSTISRMVGTQVPYEVKTKIPAKSEFKTVRWEDTMTKGLTFDKDSFKIEWTGNFTGDWSDFGKKYYDLKSNESGFMLKLNDKGLEELKNRATNDEIQFRITYKATINDSAVVDQPDSNNIKFDYSNKPNEFKDPRENEVTPKDKKISVSKTWDDGKGGTTAPAGVTVKYYLYEKGEKADLDKVVDSVEKTGTDFNHTFEKLDEKKTYYVKEIVSGYKPEYTVKNKADGTVVIKNTKDNENPTPLDPSEPKVVTYGKKFVKADEANGTRLAGAEFLIKNSDGKFLALKVTQGTEKKAYDDAQTAYIDAINAWNKAVAENNEKEADKKLGDDQIVVTIGGESITGKTEVEKKIDELKTARDDAFKALNTQWKWADNEGEALKFTSDQQGKFEVTGLAKGTYTLREVKAPAGYALPSNQDVNTFEVGPGTYTSGDISYNDIKVVKENVSDETELTEDSDIKGMTLEDAKSKFDANKDGKLTVKEFNDGLAKDAQRVNNKKVTIPQTGGIGTIIFTVAGIVMMAAAAYVLFKNNKKEEVA